MKKIGIGFKNPFKKKEEVVVDETTEKEEVALEKKRKLRNNYELKALRLREHLGRQDQVENIIKIVTNRMKAIGEKLEELTNGETFVKTFDADLSIDQYRQGLIEEKELLATMLEDYKTEQEILIVKISDITGETVVETETQEEE